MAQSIFYMLDAKHLISCNRWWQRWSCKMSMTCLFLLLPSVPWTGYTVVTSTMKLKSKLLWAIFLEKVEWQSPCRHFQDETSAPYSDLTKQLCDIYMYTECYVSKAEADRILFDITNTTNPCVENLNDERNETWQSFNDIPPNDLFINAALEYMLMNLDDDSRLAISNRADQVCWKKRWSLWLFNYMLSESHRLWNMLSTTICIMMIVMPCKMDQPQFWHHMQEPASHTTM